MRHDPRTPIGNLLGEAQVALSRERDAAEYRSVLESAVEEYERMSRMIGNMLFLARSDNDQTVLQREPIALDRLVPRVAAYFGVFERFFRVAAAREDSAAGSGLGLAIVRSIMDLHRGSVDVASDDERTVCTLRFPS